MSFYIAPETSTLLALLIGLELFLICCATGLIKDLFVKPKIGWFWRLWIIFTIISACVLTPLLGVCLLCKMGEKIDDYAYKMGVATVAGCIWLPASIISLIRAKNTYEDGRFNWMAILGSLGGGGD